jgi:hypothetical protein
MTLKYQLGAKLANLTLASKWRKIQGNDRVLSREA